MTWNCHACGAQTKLDDRGRFVQHENTFSILGERHTSGACRGSGERPQRTDEQRAKDAAGRARRKLRLVAPFRATAAVVLDALLVGQKHRGDFDRDIEILLEVALHEYRAKRPGSRPGDYIRWMQRRANGEKGWFTRTGDCYCLWCGVLLAQNVKGWNAHESCLEDVRIGPHVMRCALKHVAFDLMPVEPGTKKLPIEDLFEATA